MTKNNYLNGAFALAIVAFIALGLGCGGDLEKIAKNAANSVSDTGDATVPGDSEVKALVKETTADFADAISDEDFTKIYEKASSDFKSTYTQEQMADAFKVFIDKKSAVTPALSATAAMEPDIFPSPSMRTEKGLNILVVNGKYPTKPIPVNFEYEYVKRGGAWKMLKLVVKLQ